MKKKNLTDQEIKIRRQQAHEAEILASLDNDAEISDYAKELKEKWINGQITSSEEIDLLIKHHKK